MWRYRQHVGSFVTCGFIFSQQLRYSDVIMGAMGSQFTSVFLIVYSTACSGADQRKRQSSASLIFVREFTGDPWIPLTKGQCRTVENASFWWRHHECASRWLAITHWTKLSQIAHIYTIPRNKRPWLNQQTCWKMLNIYLHTGYNNHIRWNELQYTLVIMIKQGKSEGFESCDRPIVWKRPIWVKIGDVLSRVTLKFDGWPWKTIGHLSFAVSSFV